METADHYARLGLTPGATAAEVEASYLAIVQLLDPQKAKPELRRWAETQLALLNEAYAAVAEAAREDEGVGRPPTGKASHSTAQTSRADRGNAGKAAAGRRPVLDDEEEDSGDDDEEYGELGGEYVTPPQRNLSPTPPQHIQSKPQQGSPATGRKSTGIKAQSHQHRSRGRGRGPGRGMAVEEYNVAAPESDDKRKKMVVGLGAGLVLVLAVLLLAQFGVGPFAPSNSSVDLAQTEQPAKFDQTRYELLKATQSSDPQNYNVLFELGEMNFQSQRYDEAILWFEKVLEVRPNDVHAMQDIGTASFNTGNREKARGMWQRAATVDPNDAQTRFNLGFLYSTEQPPDIGGATREWQKVIDLEPQGSQLATTAKKNLDSLRAR